MNSFPWLVNSVQMAQSNLCRAVTMVVLLLRSHYCTALVNGPAYLSKALAATRRPLIVHVWDPNPEAVESFAIDDVSEACREAGAAAILCGIELAGAISKEQKAHTGDFPGALPVVTELSLFDLIGDPAEHCARAQTLGASGIGIRYSDTDWQEANALEDVLRDAVAAAANHGLGSLLLPEFGTNGNEGSDGAGSLAARVGAAAGLATTTEKLAFGCWDGSPESLELLRAEGFGGLLLKNACKGDVSWGAKVKQPSLAALALTRVIKASQSKGSKTIWAGAGSTGGSGGGQSTATYRADPVTVPTELEAQMGAPRWARDA